MLKNVVKLNKKGSNSREKKVAFLETSVWRRVCSFLEPGDVIQLEMTSKRIHESIDMCSEVKVRVLKYKLKNTRTMLEVLIFKIEWEGEKRKDIDC